MERLDGLTGGCDVKPGVSQPKPPMAEWLLHSEFITDCITDRHVQDKSAKWDFSCMLWCFLLANNKHAQTATVQDKRLLNSPIGTIDSDSD